MKKLLLVSLCLAMLTAACATKTTTEAAKPAETTVAATEAAPEAKKENTVVRWNYGSSGMYL